MRFFGRFRDILALLRFGQYADLASRSVNRFRLRSWILFNFSTLRVILCNRCLCLISISFRHVDVALVHAHGLVYSPNLVENELYLLMLCRRFFWQIGLYFYFLFCLVIRLAYSTYGWYLANLQFCTILWAAVVKVFSLKTSDIENRSQVK